ncbi:ensconsin-like isoform X2 [Nerophis ophidion]|uniref:ensconsin-like isoform X2 n=1 Tax=Nerophis ophidion TaxID=159077 RepID=UPI002ADF29AF|nr:ensconsin-like isoform X2 [Nerophis ophidion]
MPGSVAIMAVQKSAGARPSQAPPRGTNGQDNDARANPRRPVSSVLVPPRSSSVAGGANIDERLKAARERREEQQKLLAWRVQSRQERAQRAKLHYEQQLQERQRKLQEQKMKEERRRYAVEEKRKLRLLEEKERNETAVRRTQEKSQKAQQNFSQTLRGRKPTSSVPRHLALSTWEKNLVSRLLTPTSSYLARSKSSACQSGDEVSFYSTTSSSSSGGPQRPQEPKPQIQRPQNQRLQNRRPQELKPQIQISPNQRLQSQKPQEHKPRNQRLLEQKPQNQRPQEQKPQNHRPQNQRLQEQKLQIQRPQNHRLQNQRPKPSLSPSHSQTRSTNHRQPKTSMQHDANKRNIGPSVRSPPNKTSRTSSSPSPDQVHRRSGRRHSIPLQLDLPSVPEEDVPICTSVSSPGNSRPARISAEGQHDDEMEDSPVDPSDLLGFEAELDGRTAGDGSPCKFPPCLPEVQLRASAGTSDPEEGSRLLAEKRREARLLREREEQESLQAAEAERRSCEELERRRAEERARQQAEAQRLIADKRRREEEEQRRAEEEIAQAMKEAALLHKKREEEQTREREKAAQLVQEREMLAQKEEAERQVRKKRLEEIMRRTRRTTSPVTKSAAASILPKENSEHPVHGGAGKEAVKVPEAGTRSQQLILDHNDDDDDGDMGVPVVAFKERRSLRTLEDIQTHQRAEVI